MKKDQMMKTKKTQKQILLRKLAKVADESNSICCSLKDNKINSGGGDDSNFGGFGLDNKINSGGGDDTIEIVLGANNKINCGGGEDTVISSSESDKISKNCENVPLP